MVANLLKIHCHLLFRKVFVCDSLSQLGDDHDAVIVKIFPEQSIICHYLLVSSQLALDISRGDTKKKYQVVLHLTVVYAENHAM